VYIDGSCWTAAAAARWSTLNRCFVTFQSAPLMSATQPTLVVIHSEHSANYPARGGLVNTNEGNSILLLTGH
jgi:hypothetical protein